MIDQDFATGLAMTKIIRFLRIAGLVTLVRVRLTENRGVRL